MNEVVRQLARLLHAVLPHPLAHLDEEGAALVVLAEQLPPDLERAPRIDVEGARETLLELGGGRLVEESPEAASRFDERARIALEPLARLADRRDRGRVGVPEEARDGVERLPCQGRPSGHG